MFLEQGSCYRDGNCFVARRVAEIVGSKEQRMRVIKIFFVGVIFVQNPDTSVEHYPPETSMVFFGGWGEEFTGRSF